MVDSTTKLRPNTVGNIDDPINIAIMDVDRFIFDNRVLPVTSNLSFEPSTNNFNPDGLYSEEIFGPIGSPDRMLRFGYIELNTQIFNPKIFKIILKLGSLYKDIISGAAYAVFDPVIKDFKRVVGDPMDTPGADTGYSFFVSHFHEISFRTTPSSKRDENIKVIEQYQQRALISRYLVEPAGLRDIVNDSSGRLVQDDVNKLYTSLLLYTRSIPKGTRSPLYDPVRYQLQSKAQEIYEYIENFLDGKRGFIQGSFARRKVANGTRNVITAAPFIAASPEDPQILAADDVMVGVFQTVMGLKPYTKYAWSAVFTKPIFKNDAGTRVALTDPKTGKLVYTTITPTERDKWTSGDGVEKLINSLRNTAIRSLPVFIKDEDGKDYALALVYDEGDTIALCRSIEDLERSWPRKVNKDNLRPITYIEVFYLIAEMISYGKHVMITRYPVLEQGSTYVGKIHVVSTTPSRKVEVIDLLAPDVPPSTMRQYPVIGASYMDAAMVHPSKLGGLGGDHDGDKVSIEYIMTSDANEECAEYLRSPRSVISTDMRFTTGASTYLVDLCLHNLTYR